VGCITIPQAEQTKQRSFGLLNKGDKVCEWVDVPVLIVGWRTMFQI
jgi:hypothetical protein